MKRAWLVLIVGCSSPSHPPVRAGSSHVAVDAGPTASTKPGPAPLTDAECAALVDHAVTLGSAGAELSPEELAAIRADVSAKLGPECRTLGRDRYACAMAATTTAALTACDE